MDNQSDNVPAEGGIPPGMGLLEACKYWLFKKSYKHIWQLIRHPVKTSKAIWHWWWKPETQLPFHISTVCTLFNVTLWVSAWKWFTTTYPTTAHIIVTCASGVKAFVGFVIDVVWAILVALWGLFVASR